MAAVSLAVREDAAWGSSCDQASLAFLWCGIFYIACKLGFLLHVYDCVCANMLFVHAALMLRRDALRGNGKTVTPCRLLSVAGFGGCRGDCDCGGLRVSERALHLEADQKACTVGSCQKGELNVGLLSSEVFVSKILKSKGAVRPDPVELVGEVAAAAPTLCVQLQVHCCDVSLYGWPVMGMKTEVTQPVGSADVTAMLGAARSANCGQHLLLPCPSLNCHPAAMRDHCLAAHIGLPALVLRAAV